ncbi:MAG: UbiA prenyltransferase family protein [Phycisphaerales bacterium]|jgi:decaprenyl-phosphate phosphoribosyltransferase|nr:UbiA prenyltransferase family protein [Phycisphaerales bacterium]
MSEAVSANPDPRASRPLWMHLLKLARPTQWSKSAFVLLGPLYHLRDTSEPAWRVMLPAMVAAAAFSLAASACYVVNDLFDIEKDRAHPRKRNRPLAAGYVTPAQARVWAGGLTIASVLLAMLVAPLSGWSAAGWTLAAIGVYVASVWAYSLALKHIVMADVMVLSTGFVIRVLGGCAAVAIVPTTWLLNSTFFLAMFLAFGKRLGERRVIAVEAEREGRAFDPAAVRGVQQAYTDDLLRMSVVVTAVATLLTYAGYVQAQHDVYVQGFNLLWLTMLPATYALLRCMVLLERGTYDDPTELAVHDRAFQLAALIFAAITLFLAAWRG